MNNNLNFSYGRPRGFGGGVRPQYGGTPGAKPSMGGGVPPPGNTGIVPRHLGGGAGGGMSAPAPQMPGMPYTPGGGNSAPAPQLGGMQSGGFGGGMSTIAPDMGGGMQYSPQQAQGGTLSAPAPQMPGMSYGGDQQQMMSLFGGGQGGGMMGYGAGLPGGGMTTRQTPGINPMGERKPQTFGGGAPIIRQTQPFTK